MQKQNLTVEGGQMSFLQSACGMKGWPILFQKDACHDDAISFQYTIQKSRGPRMKTESESVQTKQLLKNEQNSQSSSEGISSLKPWHFKPKKTRFQVSDQSHSVKKFKNQRWSDAENQKYAQFLLKYSFLVGGQVVEKRKFHLNRIMSKYVATRSAVQCRSHHQKMLKAFGNRQAIIDHFLIQRTEVRGEEDMKDMGAAAEEKEKEEGEVKMLERAVFELPGFKLNAWVGNRTEWLEENSLPFSWTEQSFDFFLQ